MLEQPDIDSLIRRERMLRLKYQEIGLRDRPDEDLQPKLYAEDRAQRRAACREWWESVALLLKGHIQETRYAPNAPGEALQTLMHLANDLSKGAIREPIEDARADRGTQAMPYGQERDIAFAVAYLLAVQDGRIADQTPVARVRKMYGGVSKTAVMKWRADAERYLTFFPAFADMSEDRLLAAMEVAGKRYADNTARVNRKAGN